jgi:predicted nucleotidyltransferase
MINKHIKEEIKEEKTARISKLSRTFGLADIYVFGSRAKEIASMIRKGKIAEQLPSSDVDIGVRTLPGITLSPREISRLTIELEDLLAVSKVDVVLLSRCEPFLALDIVRGELLYSVDPIDQARHELFIFRRAGDLLPFKKHRMEQILTRDGR